MENNHHLRTGRNGLVRPLKLKFESDLICLNFFFVQSFIDLRDLLQDLQVLLCRSVFKRIPLLLCPGYMYEVLHVLPFRTICHSFAMPQMSAGVREDIPSSSAAASSQPKAIRFSLHHFPPTALPLPETRPPVFPSA